MYCVFVLLVCVLAAYAANTHTTIKVVETYSRAGSGWISIDLHKVGQITRVDWCKSTTPNRLHKARNPRATDIDECRAPGLMHLQLYPRLVRMLPEEPGVVYIDPNDIGGLDTMHQFDILVHVNINETASLVQVMRFNVLETLSSAEPTTESPQTTTVAAATQEPQQQPAGAAVSIDVAVEETVSAQSAETVSSKPYLAGLLIVLLGGFAILAISGTLKLKQRRSQLTSYMKSHGFWLERAEDVKDIFDDSNVDDDEDVIEMEEINMRRLVGMGVSPAFHENS